MHTNKIGKIAVGIDGHKQSKFNLSRDVETSMTWGDCEPLFCKKMLPHSEIHMSAENLTRLAPLNVPTFGRMKYHTLSQFVPINRIFPRWDSMISGEPTYGEASNNISAGAPSVPKNIPCAVSGILAMFSLAGAQCSIWSSNVVINDTSIENLKNNSYLAFPTLLDTDTVTSRYHEIHWLTSTLGLLRTGTAKTNYCAGNPVTDIFHEVSSLGAINIAKLASLLYANSTDPYIQNMLSDWSTNTSMWLPLDSSKAMMYGGHTSTAYQVWTEKHDLINGAVNFVSPQDADIIIPIHCNDSTQHATLYKTVSYLCFKLSDAGRRYLKLLRGLEYPTDIGSDQWVSLLPLCAWDIAYWNAFGVNTHTNFEQTPYARLMKMFSIQQSLRVGSATYTNDFKGWFVARVFEPARQIMTPFIEAHYNFWVTDCQDYASICMRQPNNDQDTSHVTDLIDVFQKGGFIDVTGNLAGMIQAPNNYNTTVVGSSGQYHNEMTDKLLAIAYKWSNRQQLIGEDLEKALKARGLEKYIPRFPCDFIGHTSTNLNIQEVSSATDTYDSATGEGTLLGEYGAKSCTYSKEQAQHWKTDVDGYWITMAYIVPESGYCQGCDPEIFDVDRESQYIPDFDAIGYETTRKSNFFGHGRFCTSPAVLADPSAENFGFAPRDSHRKMTRNIINGNFYLGSKRNSFMPYHLDRYAYLGDINKFTDFTDNTGNGSFGNAVVDFTNPVTRSDIPNCGISYRSPYRYPWLTQLDRIFQYVGDREKWVAFGNGAFDKDSNTNNWFDFTDDNFLCHNVLHVAYKAPMKPIEVSFDTYDEDKGANGSMSKS